MTHNRKRNALAFALATTCILTNTAAYEVCHLCRDQSFPYKPSGGIVVLNENLDLDKEVYTCEEFYWMGLRGQISGKACGPIVASHQVFCQCGEQYAAEAAASALWSATNPFGNSVTFPNSGPTRFTPPVAPAPVQWPVTNPTPVVAQPTWQGFAAGPVPVANPTRASWPTGGLAGATPTASAISWPIPQPTVSTPTAWSWSNPTTPVNNAGVSWGSPWSLRGEVATNKPPLPPTRQPTWPVTKPTQPSWPVVVPPLPVAAPTQPSWPVVAPTLPVAAPTQPVWPVVAPPAFSPIAYQSWPTITAPTTAVTTTKSSKKDKMSKSMGMERQLRG